MGWKSVVLQEKSEITENKNALELHEQMHHRHIGIEKRRG
jgi:hypothetical protein